MDSESRLQAECVRWFSRKYPLQRGLLFSVHNNAGNEVSGAVAVSLGRVAGVSDLVYLSPSGALLIEMKTDKGTQSENQVNWQKKVEQAGYTYAIIRSLEAFKEVVEKMNRDGK